MANTEIRPHENGPAEPGRERGAFSSSSSSSLSSSPGTTGTAVPAGTAAWLPPHSQGYVGQATSPCAGALLQVLPPEWRGHSCLRTSPRADRNVCPTLPRSSTARTASPYSCAGALLWKLPRRPTPFDPRQPPSTPIEACERQYRHCLLLLTSDTTSRPLFRFRQSVGTKCGDEA